MLQIISVVAALAGAVSGPTALISLLLKRKRPTILGYDLEHGPAFYYDVDAKRPMKVQVDEDVITKPHRVTLYLKATGPRDIRKDNFDSSDLILRLGAGLVGIIDQDGFDADSIICEPKSQAVKIAPQVLKRNMLLRVSLLVDGKPTPELDAKLPDVGKEIFNHTDFTDKDRQASRRVQYALIAGSAVLLLSGVAGWWAAMQANKTEASYRDFALQVAATARNAQIAAAQSQNPQSQKALQDYLTQLGQLGVTQSFQPSLGSSYGDYYKYTYGIPGGTGMWVPGSPAIEPPPMMTSPKPSGSVISPSPTH